MKGCLGMPGWRLVVALGALWLPAGAGATTLLEVYEAAVDNDAQVLAARANHRAVSMLVPQARAGLLPSASVGGFTEKKKRTFPGAAFVDTNPSSRTFGRRISVPNDIFNQHGYQAELRQPVFAAENYFNWRSAQASREQSGFALADTEQDLIVRAARAYLEVLRAEDRLLAAVAQEAAFARQLEQVQQRFDVGLVAVTDVLEAQAAFDDAQVSRIQAEGSQDIVFETLTTLTGVPYAAVARFTDELPIKDPEPGDAEQWVAAALDHNYAIKAAERSLLAAQRTLRARKAAHTPTIDAGASFTHFVTGGRSFLGGKTNETTFQLSATIPLLQGGFLWARDAEAEARAEQARQLLEDRRRTVIRDARNLFRAAATDVDRVRARARAVRSAASALEATRTGYEVGTRNIVDVLQAEQNYVLSRFDFADARYTYVLDILLLKQAAGTLSADDLRELNGFIDPKDLVSKIGGRSAQLESPGEISE